MRKDKRIFFENLYTRMEEQNDVKGLYRSTRKQLGWEDNGPPQLLVIQGRRIEAPKKIAQEQLKFFNHKVDKLMQEIPRPTENPTIVLEEAMENWDKDGERDMLELSETTEKAVLDIINSMGNSTACGKDTIDSIALKVAGGILAKPIAHVTNLSIKNSNFTDSWKTAKIIPLYKGKGTCRQSPGNYIPVAMLPSISKIVEKVVQSQIYNFMDTSNQFNSNLHAYRAGYSMTSALLQLSDSILEATDENFILTLVTIDKSLGMIHS